MMLLSSSFYLILFLTQFNRTQSNSYFCDNYEEDTEFEADDLTPVAFIQKTKEGYFIITYLVIVFLFFSFRVYFKRMS
jgi:hypothetical protein